MSSSPRIAHALRNGLGAAVLAAFGLLAVSVTPAEAADPVLGNYFQTLPKGVPPIKQAAAPRARAAVSMQRASFNATAPLDTGMLEQSAFAHINLYRLSKGMRPLSFHSGLADRARTHSTNMSTGASPINHDGMRDRLAPYLGGLFGSRAGGEIIAFNRNMGDPARVAMQSWINSYRHKDIIEEDYTRVGVGVAVRPDGGYYFTALFIR
jgi:uncharacterized protein YkwD